MKQDRTPIAPIARQSALFVAAASLGWVLACANAIENDQNRVKARSRGLYQVRIANEDEKEKITGSCKFVRTINADDDPVRRPMDAELRDYFRAEAVYLGADTVYIDRRTADAYICGPGPLNPDGTRKAPEPAPK